MSEIDAVAHRHHHHAATGGMRRGDDHVELLGAAGDGAMLPHPVQRGDLVAQACRQLELQLACRLLHLHAQLMRQLVAPPFQQARRLCYVVGVILPGNQLHAGRRAALDLVLQAGAAAVGEERIVAGPQQEQLLQGLQGFPHRAGAGIRPKVLIRPGLGATVKGDARILVRGDAHVGEALVVAQRDVVARCLFLDQRRFQQQRLILGVGQGDFDALDLPHHAFDARIAAGAQEIAADALAQIARLADVEQLVAGVVHAVDARLRGQLGQEGAGVERLGRLVHRHTRIHARIGATAPTRGRSLLAQRRKDAGTTKAFLCVPASLRETLFRAISPAHRYR